MTVTNLYLGNDNWPITADATNQLEQSKKEQGEKRAEICHQR